ncbi:tetratricopeptide repeat protein [Candidatus Colwellia aromaticivorans]|uniref:tetratricopeptide repeat protein n=1 Tax=Candidatus Colwellia aromaticivorans TaxID=2267621 RepID=UPI000DF20B06|nr:tetratricopeptide repeat protein [Candidatus Colwellia aromaticivorans]
MIFRFNCCELNTENFTLQVNGALQLVEPHVFDLILYLINHRNRLVSRDELFENLWAGREVCDAALSNNIKCARAVLGDDGERQAIIKTTRGRGYQFIAEINAIPCEANSSNMPEASINATNPIIFPAFNNKGYLWPLLAVTLLLFLIISYNILTPVSEKNVNNAANSHNLKSIAVLPFNNHSELEKDVFFTRGVHDDLLVQISKISAVKSISRPSVMTYLNSGKDVQTIGKELGVATILQGSVQRATENIRINVHLINALTNENIWAESYTRKLTAKNVFAIQEEIAKTIATTLETVLSPKEIADLERLPTQNMAALEAYFRAKESGRKNTHDGNKQAIAHLENAITLDPSFSTAYALLAILHVGQIYWTGLPAKEQLVKAESLIATSMKLDNNSSELYRAIGRLRSYEQNYQAADTAFKRAININPNNTAVYMSYAQLNLRYLNNIPQAVSLLSTAYTLNPNDDNLAATLAQAYIKAGRFNDAREKVEDVFIRKPTFAKAYRVLTSIEFFGEHNIAEALRSLSIAIQLDPNVPFNSMLMGLIYIHLGDNQQAIAWLSHAIALAPEFSGANHAQGFIHQLRGDYNAAIDSYLKVSKSFMLVNESMYNLMKAGLQTQRSTEVIAHYQKIYPELFEADVKVDATNFVVALGLGRLLKQQGKIAQATKLLTGSLKAAQVEIHGGWADEHNNWQAQIYLALGDKKAALKAFSEVVEQGWHSEKLINDPDYLELHSEPIFQQLVQNMQFRLKLEREKIKKMKSSGELSPIPAIP